MNWIELEKANLYLDTGSGEKRAEQITIDLDKEQLFYIDLSYITLKRASVVDIGQKSIKVKSALGIEDWIYIKDIVTMYEITNEKRRL